MLEVCYTSLLYFMQDCVMFLIGAVVVCSSRTCECFLYIYISLRTVVVTQSPAQEAFESLCAGFTFEP